MLDRLRRIVQEVSGASSLGTALHITVQQVREAVDAEACSIFLLDRQKGDFVLMATEGLNPHCVGKLRIDRDDSLVGLVAKRGEPINLDNAPQHEKFFPLNDAGEEKFKAFLGVPIIHQRVVVGVLFVQQEEARKFDETEEAFLITLSAQLAGVIAHAEATGLMASLAAGHYNADEEATLLGVPGAPGVGIGQVVVVFPLADLEAVPDRQAENIDNEIEQFELALNAAQDDIRRLSERMSQTLPPEEQALFDAYLLILDKASLGQEVIEVIRNEGKWSQTALCQVIREHVNQFAAMDDPYLKERATDIEDLGRRVLSHLQSKQQSRPNYPENTVLIGEEVTPSALADVPDGYLQAVVSSRGSSNSHLAILARAMGVPTVMGVEGVNTSQLEGHNIIVDGYYGQIFLSPSETLLAEYQGLADGEKSLAADLDELRDLPAQTLDGYQVSLSVNTGLVADIGRSLSVGADGVGLYRTEIPFMLRDRFPTETEQMTIYQQLLAAFSPRPVIMRTLDVGGDKTLSYLPIEEENPFLGWRGIRITLDHPEVFRVQARAMLRASEKHPNLRILLPMITSMSEVDDTLDLLKQAHKELLDEGLEIPMPPVGVMIEVPSSVYQSRALAKKVDFLSVGTNDLTQYLLAVDRNNPRVAGLYDCLHPAVLRALLYVVENAHKEGKVASVCGEMAGDPAAVIPLVAMGFDSLSMNANSLPRVKWVVRKLKLSQAQELLEEILQMQDSIVVRLRLEQVLEDLGLGGLIRAGRK